MKSQKLFATLLIGAWPIIVSSSAQAQTFASYKRCSEQLAASARTQAVEQATTETPSAARLEAQQGGLLDAVERQKKAIVGSWFISLGCGCKILASFTSDGLFSEVGQGDIQPVGAPNPSSTAGYGTWTHNGGRQFAITFLIIGYDLATSEFRGTLKVRINLTLNEAGDQLSGTDKADIFDPEGHLVDSFTTGTMQGTRIKVEPLN